MQRCFFLCFLSEQGADHREGLKPVPRGLCGQTPGSGSDQLCMAVPAGCNNTNTRPLMCMRRGRLNSWPRLAPAATLSFSPGAAHQTCRQAAWGCRGKEGTWCRRGRRVQHWLFGPGGAEGFGICSAAGLYRNTIPCCQSRGMRLVRFCSDGLCCHSPNTARGGRVRSARLGIRCSFWNPPRAR